MGSRHYQKSFSRQVCLPDLEILSKNDTFPSWKWPMQASKLCHAGDLHILLYFTRLTMMYPPECVSTRFLPGIPTKPSFPTA